MVTLQQPIHVGEIYNCYIQCAMTDYILLLCIFETQHECHTLKYYIAIVRFFLIRH